MRRFDASLGRLPIGGKAMSYADRMCFRMMVGCLVPLVVSIPVAYVVDTLSGLPAALGGPLNQSDVPFFVGMGGAGLSLVALATR